MPKVTRSRLVGAEPSAVWKLVGDPAKLPRWWPAVERVDRPEPGRFTKWVISPRGKAVPMSFRLAGSGPGLSVRWEQELAGTAFERAIRSASEELSVEPADGGSTVRLCLNRRLRGTARLGFLFISRGQRRELESALDRLQERVDGQA